MARKPLIAIVGSGSDTGPAVSNAREIGRMVAENGWILVSGGRNAGVMKAANEGAKEAANGLTIGILPTREAEIAADIDVAIITDTGQARNNIIVLSADVVIACGVDGAGTASEVALAIKNKKPVVLLAATETAQAFFVQIGGDQIHTASSPSEAIGIVKSYIG